jgi:O-methyltransferase
MNMIRTLITNSLHKVLRLPFILHFLFDRECGREYSVGMRKKIVLLWRMWRNEHHVETLSTILEHLEMASALLRVPRSVSGDVIECGCYKGGSSVNLSLVCAMVGRRLVICDSFQGLPEPADYDKFHYSLQTRHTNWYVKGRFAVGVEEVKQNLARYGRLDVCDFVVGYFQDTLHRLNRIWVLGFLDVDLVDSLKPCLSALWPQLQEGCRLYVHEAKTLFLAAVFFDSAWWRREADEDAPGLVGAGSGLALEAFGGSELGFAQKGSSVSRGWKGEPPGQEVFEKGALSGECYPHPVR